MSIGNTVKILRKARKMTQAQLADRANMSRSYLADLEGDRYNPSINTIKAIALALNVDTSTLMKTEDKGLDFVIKEGESVYAVEEKSSSEEKLLEEVVELSDKEIKEKHTFMIDGRELTEEEFRRMIAAVRADRLYRDEQ